jgi:hypothetical protein
MGGWRHPLEARRQMLRRGADQARILTKDASQDAQRAEAVLPLPFGDRRVTGNERNDVR